MPKKSLRIKVNMIQCCAILNDMGRVSNTTWGQEIMEGEGGIKSEKGVLSYSIWNCKLW